MLPSSVRPGQHREQRRGPSEPARDREAEAAAGGSRWPLQLAAATDAGTQQVRGLSTVRPNGQPYRALPPMFPQPYPAGESAATAAAVSRSSLPSNSRFSSSRPRREREIRLQLSLRVESRLQRQSPGRAEKAAQRRSHKQVPGSRCRVPASDPYAAAHDRRPGFKPDRCSVQPVRNPVATATADKRAAEVNVSARQWASPMSIFEGATLDTVLMNRLDGDAPGPVKVLVSNPLLT